MTVFSATRGFRRRKKVRNRSSETAEANTERNSLNRLSVIGRKGNEDEVWMCVFRYVV